MRESILAVLLAVSGLAHAEKEDGFDALAIQAFERTMETHRAQTDNRREKAQAAIESQTEAAQKILESLSRLEASMAETRKAIAAGAAGERLSLAVGALASEMGSVTFAATRSAGDVAGIKRLAHGPARDEGLIYKAAVLAAAADRVKKRGRDDADDICLRIVLPLRRMRRVEDFRQLAGGAPALKSAATRLSVEADHLVDFLSRDPRPGPGPADPIPNFCNPEDIPPRG